MDTIEFRHTEQSDLRESERRLAEAQRIAGIGCWEQDLGADRITWSDETYRILGMQPQECPMDITRLRKQIHPEDREAVAQTVAAATQEGLNIDTEYHLIRPDSEVRFVHAFGSVTKDQLGRAAQFRHRARCD